jgi:hypothetical protein
MKQKWKLFKLINKDKRLNDAARRVAFSLLDRENNRTGRLFPSHKRIAIDSSLSLSSVKRGIKTLIDYKYLTRLKIGYTGRATEYKINYNVELITQSVDNSVDKLQNMLITSEYDLERGSHLTQEGVRSDPKRVSGLSHQLTNIELTNIQLTVEDEKKKNNIINMDKKNEAKNILNKLVKSFNPNYRRVVDGTKLKYLDPESIRRRYVDKTGNYNESFKWKESYLNPKTSKEAWDYAVYIGIVKEFKNNGR